MTGAVRLRQLLKEQRVPLRPIADRAELGRRNLAELRQCLEQLKRLIRSKRCQLHGGDIRPSRQCGKERP